MYNSMRPMGCSMPGFPVLHYLPGVSQISRYLPLHRRVSTSYYTDAHILRCSCPEHMQKKKNSILSSDHINHFLYFSSFMILLTILQLPYYFHFFSYIFPESMTFKIYSLTETKHFLNFIPWEQLTFIFLGRRRKVAKLGRAVSKEG